jgi:hypothetical protein
LLRTLIGTWQPWIFAIGTASIAELVERAPPDRVVNIAVGRVPVPGACEVRAPTFDAREG